MPKVINVVDLFAGPGGLGEGFSAFSAKAKGDHFQIRMSVEKEASAHQTLTLRALYRNLRATGDQRYYHEYLAGETDRVGLQARVADAWQESLAETLDAPRALGEDNSLIHKRLKGLVHDRQNEPWIVIGGPPCQAYSLAGRSRNKGIKGYRPEKDNRHFLYQEYLEVLAIVQPQVFVMENVKGILTSRVGGTRIFPSIRADLQNPSKAIGKRQPGKQYRIYSLSTAPASDTFGVLGDDVVYGRDADYVIRAEQFGVPQARHRVILLGVCTDIDREPCLLEVQSVVPIEQVLTGLPPLRSRLSGAKDDPEKWEMAIRAQAATTASELRRRGSRSRALAGHIDARVKSLKSQMPVASDKRGLQPFSSRLPDNLRRWLDTDPPPRLINHEARGHMESDLGRYFFSACWAELFSGEESPVPKAEHFPRCLAPNHANWESGHFADRFRVQCRGRPATTITSHISKDGHYFIHYDPTQCRALTVREAARIQTFPDNYCFEGNRTQQYVQVGNAVPPYLARQIAEVVYDLIR